MENCYRGLEAHVFCGSVFAKELESLIERILDLQRPEREENDGGHWTSYGVSVRAVR
jgi:hypothetical protein